MLVELLRAHHRGRTGEGRLLLLTEGDDHHLVDHLGIALQEYAHTVLGGHRLALKAQIGNLQLVLTCGEGNVEPSVHVSQHTGTRTYHLDGSANDGLTVFL